MVEVVKAERPRYAPHSALPSSAQMARGLRFPHARAQPQHDQNSRAPVHFVRNACRAQVNARSKRRLKLSCRRRCSGRVCAAPARELVQQDTCGDLRAHVEGIVGTLGTLAQTLGLNSACSPEHASAPMAQHNARSTSGMPHANMLASRARSESQPARRHSRRGGHRIASGFDRLAVGDGVLRSSPRPNLVGPVQSGISRFREFPRSAAPEATRNPRYARAFTQLSRADEEIVTVTLAHTTATGGGLEAGSAPAQLVPRVGTFLFLTKK